MEAYQFALLSFLCLFVCNQAEAEAKVLERASTEVKRGVEMSRLLLAIHGHWVEKRRQIGKPLLRQFWPTTPLSDTNPHNVFRPREKEGYRLRKTRGRNENPMEIYKRMEMMRDGFSQAKEILELIRKREIVKQEILCVTYEQFNQSLADTTGAKYEPESLKRQVEMLKTIDPDNSGLVVEGREASFGRDRNNRLMMSSPSMAAGRSASHMSATSMDRVLELPTLQKVDYTFICGGWKLPENAPPVFWSIPKALAKQNDKALIVSPAYTEDILNAGPAFGTQVGQRLAVDTFMSLLSGHSHGKLNKLVNAFLAIYNGGREGSSHTNESASGSIIGSSPAANVPQGLASEAEAVGMRGLLNKISLGQVVGGGAWEDEAGLVLGIGAVSSEGHGWENVGHFLECAPPPTNYVGDDDLYWLDELAWEGLSTTWLTDAHWTDSLPSSRRRRRRRKRYSKRAGAQRFDENEDLRSSEDETFLPPYIARPRMARGGRIVIDRLPMTRRTAQYWRLALPLLSRRRKLRRRAIENWQKKIADHPSLEIISSHQQTKSDTRVERRGKSAHKWPTQSSALPSTLLNPHEGDAFDPHSYNAITFHLSTTHGPEVDPPSDGYKASCTHVRLTTRTSYLAPSRFQPASLATAMVESIADSVNIKADKFDSSVPMSSVDPRQREIIKCGFVSGPVARKKRKKKEKKYCCHVSDVYDRDEGIGRGMDDISSGFGSAVDVGYGHWFQTSSRKPVCFSSQTSHSGILKDPPMSKGVSRKKLEEIYNLPDSDDEELLSSAFHDSPFAPRSRTLK